MSDIDSISRRHFLRNMTMGAGGVALLGSFGLAFRFADSTGKAIRGIVVDFTKCTGCRTCETICSAFNNKVVVNGEKLNGLGNPWMSNIKVHWFNPDVDVPMVCSICEDAPCINACPVEADDHGNKPLYHHSQTMAVRLDEERCIACGRCIRACSSTRTGVISRNKNRKPFGICSLCDGDPQCVKHCSYDALNFVELTANADYRKLPAKEIARRLIWEFYEIEI